ncbi:hypothetical protein BKA63DRAFT_209960 [Paraphoma chrysanthemicola]|nr:hypothetical protein BKA63DRAFT_209960 [Paraphoma chrysanthemicola]
MPNGRPYALCSRPHPPNSENQETVRNHGRSKSSKHHPSYAWPSISCVCAFVFVKYMCRFLGKRACVIVLFLYQVCMLKPAAAPPHESTGMVASALASMVKLHLAGALARWRVMKSMPFGLRKEPGNCRKYKTVALLRAKADTRCRECFCCTQESCVVIKNSWSSGSRSSWSENRKVVKVVNVRTSRSVINKGNYEGETQGNISPQECARKSIVE